MTVPARPSVAHRKSNARQPLMRPPPSRAQTATPTLTGRTIPMENVTSTTVPTKSPARSVNGGVKRKERDFERDSPDEETNINVVVRCRGRNDREVRENSGVVVSTEGVKGKKVDLSMGPSALSNKTYNFDKVFSPAATQEMLFEDVVSPILDEVLAGFNCTIFAYGQTGTGKTYTMSGDITDMQPLPDAAGIIPRTLYGLFDRLGEDEGENSVKCSFIELYNEELRDLLSHEDNAKLKIYDDNSKKGQTTTLVQGMEESHIKSASKGLELLRKGSYKRQVAATKCNDLSSRSHTVFTITVYMKKTSDTGEDFVSAGKLNLVDLAGSENIQRSGAENKRAAEAGLINKSLLTLGRVINALVEKSTHIPYRESKLTRLLQDSLGGRTKTCIVATLSPAKSNLEETISTLDYAFRAKNIKNKPQANQMVSKKTMLREFTSEIEKLKNELMATRQRNGVYLTQEAYEEITTESESRRILSEEQRDKIEIIETSLRNKVQELFTLTSTFNSLKKDSDAVKVTLDGTQGLLDKTELVLSHTRKSLAEETYLRKAYQSTEDQLHDVGGDLMTALEATTGDIRGLHAKLRRRSDLHSSVREAWGARRTGVVQTAQDLESRMEALRTQQESLLQTLSVRMQSYVSDELNELEKSREFLDGKVEAFKTSEAEVNVQTAKAKDDMDTVLGEIKTLREDVKDKVGAGMQQLSEAAQRISAGIASELEAFHTQLHGSYSSLGREFKSIFEDITRQVGEQKFEVERLQAELLAANTALAESNAVAHKDLVDAVVIERETASSERTQLLSQITNLINQSAEAQDARLQSHLNTFTASTTAATTTHLSSRIAQSTSMTAWSDRSASLLTTLANNRDTIKSRIKADWSAANGTTDTIKRTTESVHHQTLDIVNAQMSAMDSQLASLDEIISRVRAQNESHHAAHSQSLAKLSEDVTMGYASIGSHMATSLDRTEALSSSMTGHLNNAASTLAELGSSGQLRSVLASMRDEVMAGEMAEYVPDGTTPAKTVYSYPTSLPRTEGRDTLLARMRGEPIRSPAKTNGVYIDSERENAVVIDGEAMEIDRPKTLSRSSSLRELDPNRPLAQAVTVSVSAPASATKVGAQPTTLDDTTESTPEVVGVTSKIPSFSRSVSTASLPVASKNGGGGRPSKRMTVAVGTEKENLVPAIGLGLNDKIVERVSGGNERRSGRLRSRGSD